MPDETQWYWIEGGEQTGPWTPGDVQHALHEGRISQETPFWREGMEDWRPAGQIPDLQALFSAPPSIRPTGHQAPPIEHAGFWLRVVAFMLDSIIIGGAAAVLGFMLLMFVGLLGSLGGGGGLAFGMLLIVLCYILAIFAPMLIFAGMHASRHQGTPGKILLGIKVTDARGGRIGFGHALVRELARIITAMTLGIGYILAGCTQNKQALHDMIVSTFVVRRH